MKFVVSTVTLINGLRTISDVFEPSSLPILRNFLFEIREGKMRISCANKKDLVNAELKVESKDSGCFALSPRVLLDILKCFPEQQLTFKINKETLRMRVISETGFTMLRGANAEKLRKEIRKRHPNALSNRHNSEIKITDSIHISN